jgi:hypothetical protein
MANVDWQGFLRGIRESIETIRTPIDPIAIQGTAHAVNSFISIPSGQTGVVSCFPPSDGYNRVTVLLESVTGADLFVHYQQPQKNVVEEFFGYALSNPLTGAHINPVPGVAYTIQIPDRNCGITCTLLNDRGNATSMHLKCIFWRQY